MLKVAVREYKSEKVIDIDDFPVDVSLRPGGEMYIALTKAITYHHDKPSMRIEWGLLDEKGSFWPLPIKFASPDPDYSYDELRSHVYAEKGQEIILHTISFSASFAAYSNTMRPKRVGWFVK